MNFSVLCDLMNGLPDAICVININSNKTLFLNDTFSKQLLSRDLLIGQSFENQILKDDSKAKYATALKQAKETSNDIVLGMCKSQSTIGKEKFPVYRNYFWVLKKINDECIMLRGNADTAKYSLPEHANFDYVEELIDFFQNAPIALHWLSGTGHILWANNTEMESLGYTKEEYIGHHIMEFCPDEEVALNRVFGDLSSGKTIRDKPFKFRTKTGELKYLIVDSNVSWNPDGTFKHTRCFIRDDTQRRINEEIKAMELKTLKTLNQRKDEFIRRAFHDIKTPLHVIANSISEIKDSVKSNTMPKLDDIILMQQSIDGIISTSEDINYSIKFGQGCTISLNPTRYNLEKAMQDTFTHAEAIEKRSSQTITLSYNFRNCPEFVNMDSDIFRVFMHLFRNAIRFSPDCAIVKVEVSTVESFKSGSKRSRKDGDTNNNTIIQPNFGDLYSFRITNNTVKPIDLKDINYNFHHSYSMMDEKDQNDTTGLTCTKGLGLGLYVSYNIIQAMGGMLKCTSDGNSVSFSFKLRLQSSVLPSPMTMVRSSSRRITAALTMDIASDWTDVESAPAARAHVIEDHITFESLTLQDTQSGETTQASSISERILVVDDSQMCQRVLVRALQKHNYIVDTADNGLEAIEKLSIEPCLYKACLMDLRMPIMDGITATKECRQKFHLRNFPIIVVTAELGEEIQNQAKQAGANSIISKPAGSTEIIAAIRNHYKVPV